MLAADRARLAGHAEQGAELLRKLLREHPDDPRAPLAAFTLGRLLLTELGRPAEAAAAFAQVRRLSPHGAFAEDALAREVEALGKAGLAADARARADEYQRLYPQWAAHGDGEDGRRNQVRFSRVALFSAWASVAATSSLAVAQESASPTRGHVQLEVVGCPAVPTAVVRRVLSVEIGDLLLDGTGGQAGDADRLTIRCAGNFASVEARGPSGEPPTERILRLDDFPGDAAPRALALLGVELLAARSATVRERIMRRQTGVAPAIETAGPPPAPRWSGPRDLRIGAAGVWRTFVQQAGASAFGGRLEASSTALSFGIISGDAEISVGSKDVDSVGRTTAVLILEQRHVWPVRGAPALQRRRRAGRAHRAGPGVREQRQSHAHQRLDVHPPVGRADVERPCLGNARSPGFDDGRRSRMVVVFHRRGGGRRHGHRRPGPLARRLARRRPAALKFLRRR